MAAVLALIALLGGTGGAPLPFAIAGVAAAVAAAVLARWRPAAERYVIAGAILAGSALVAMTARGTVWLIAIVALGAAAAVALALKRRARELDHLAGERAALATQLDRRINELFSLQELTYVLAESIALDRMIEQVARYALRFLRSEGAVVVLVDEGSEAGTLRVACGLGTLAPLAGRRYDRADGSVIRLAIARERIEVAQGLALPTIDLLAGVMVRSAAVAPLRTQGVTMGALAVADRQDGPYTTEDLWLLSTVAMQTSLTLANARLYEMVRRSTEEWETAFNALAEGIAVVGPDGRVLRSNDALVRISELSGGDLVDRPFVQTLFGTSAAAEGLIAAALRGERTPPLLTRSERGRRTLRLTAAPVAAREHAGSIVVLVEDVTEQRAMESQLIQNEKMASIGQLVSGVAHELNNPLTSIRGLAELLLERGSGGEMPREHLRVIYDQAERAGRIVRNLLTFARKGAPEKAGVDLNDVVARTALLIAYELKLRGIELETRLASEPVPVLGDRYELQQVLLNLVTNAVQAVTDLEDGRPRLITVVTEREAEQVHVRVRDSGPGVPPDLVPYLFTPFFTTKGPGQGTGLGLSLSYGLIESHGGRLTYVAPADGGAEFLVTLPRLADEQALEAARRPGPRLSIRRVLVVDGDAAAHRVLSALFGPDGHLVDAARTAEQGLEMAAERRYDLVIADARLAMPGGEPFVSTLLARLPEYRGRLLVAVEPGVGPEALAAGAGDVRYVEKPFNPRDVRALAAEALR